MTAGDYTLEVQAEREALVVFMRHICSLLEKGVRFLQDIQAARKRKFLGGGSEFSKSRLTSDALSRIPGLRARVF